jgi:hypothetical protein
MLPKVGSQSINQSINQSISQSLNPEMMNLDCHYLKIKGASAKKRRANRID